MQTLNTILNIVLIVLSIAMIAVVLMQQSKSAGLGSAFGDTQSFTARGQKASREAKLQRITKILAVAIGVIAIAMAIIS